MCVIHTVASDAQCFWKVVRWAKRNAIFPFFYALKSIKRKDAISLWFLLIDFTSLYNTVRCICSVSFDLTHICGLRTYRILDTRKMNRNRNSYIMNMTWIGNYHGSIFNEYQCIWYSDKYLVHIVEVNHCYVCHTHTHTRIYI